jgi:hypothetical protein
MMCALSLVPQVSLCSCRRLDAQGQPLAAGYDCWQFDSAAVGTTLCRILTPALTTVSIAHCMPPAIHSAPLTSPPPPPPSPPPPLHLPPAGAVQPVPLAALWPAGSPEGSAGGGQAARQAQGGGGVLPGGAGGEEVRAVCVWGDGWGEGVLRVGFCEGYGGAGRVVVWSRRRWW